MARVLVFPHARGVTPGLRGFAKRLDLAGHDVAIVDLFDGRTFDSVEKGIAHAESIGFGEIVERAVAAFDSAGQPTVVIGFSLGVLPAQKLAQTEPDVVGAVLCHSAVPAEMFGELRDIPIQIHLNDADPFAEEDRPAAEEMARAANVELFTYPGEGHLIADVSSTDFDPAASSLVMERTFALLDRVGGAHLEIDDHGRPEPPLAADEVGTLIGFLDYQRATLEWKTRGLGPEGLSTSVAASTMTLGGLLKHLAYVEDDWSVRWLAGEERPEPWRSVDWSADRDWDWNSARADTPGELRNLWRSSVERSRAHIAVALATTGPDGLARRPWPDGSAPSLRWILVHLIEEYARHNGHADLLREAIDGETGE